MILQVETWCCYLTMPVGYSNLSPSYATKHIAQDNANLPSSKYSISLVGLKKQAFSIMIRPGLRSFKNSLNRASFSDSDILLLRSVHPVMY